MPGTRIELVQSEAPRDFKSLASTYSATQASILYNNKISGCQTERPALLTVGGFSHIL